MEHEFSINRRSLEPQVSEMHSAKQSNSAAKKKWFANEDDMLEYTRMEMYKFLHIEYRSIGFGW